MKVSIVDAALLINYAYFHAVAPARQTPTPQTPTTQTPAPQMLHLRQNQCIARGMIVCWECTHHHAQHLRMMLRSPLLRAGNLMPCLYCCTGWLKCYITLFLQLITVKS